MENNEINKSNKIKIIVITALIFLVSIAGISYAYFTIQVVGNDTASSMRLRTANMSLVYNDVQIVSGEYAQPGWSDTKTLTVTNNGNVEAKYAIIWRDLINGIENNELVISATCSATSGSCEAISETAVPEKKAEANNIVVKSYISIPVGVTHTYTLTALFKETGSNQNYNQNKSFNGTLNIAESGEAPQYIAGTSNPREVRIGTEEFYVLNDISAYSTLVSGNPSMYGYSSEKTILFAKYNVHEGLLPTGNNGRAYFLTPTDTDYGIQKQGTDAEVAFAAQKYWEETSTKLYDKYGSYSSFNNNIYDSSYNEAPVYIFTTGYYADPSQSPNFSIAYYIDEYLGKNMIEGVGRLLTYNEARALGCDNGGTCNSAPSWVSSSSYWMATAGQAGKYSNFIWRYATSGNQFDWDNHYQQFVVGLRPVIVVNTSDIQSS